MTELNLKNIAARVRKLQIRKTVRSRRNLSFYKMGKTSAPPSHLVIDDRRVTDTEDWKQEVQRVCDDRSTDPETDANEFT